MHTLESLAKQYANNESDAKIIRVIIGKGIVHPDVNTFIDHHKDGWIGTNGKFARILCVALMATNTL